MSIEAGTGYDYNDLLNPRNKVFDNERIRMYSDVQSNIIELSSGCNETIITMDLTQLGSSYIASNFFIDTFIYDRIPYRWIELSTDTTTINTSSAIIKGSIHVASNIEIAGGININTPFDSTNTITSNLVVYADPYNGASFVVASNSVRLFALETSSNSLIVKANVGIGTSIPIRRLHVNGTMCVTDRFYLPAISSNNSSIINLNGNLDVYGNLATTGIIDFTKNIIGISALNIANTKFATIPALSLSQRMGYEPLTVISIIDKNNNTTVISGISSSGRTYIGTDVTNIRTISMLEQTPITPAMFTVALPSSFSNDGLIKATSISQNNPFFISSNAYIGIGTCYVRHPLHIHMQSDRIDVPLLNVPSIGLYHTDVSFKPFISFSSNNTSVFSIDGNGLITIGQNGLQLNGSNGLISSLGTLYCSNLLFIQSLLPTNDNIPILGFGTIQASYATANSIYSCNMFLSNINSINTYSRNITSPVVNVANDSILNNMYINGTIKGPNINLYYGIATNNAFIPGASGTGSITQFTSYNVLVSSNTDYRSEITGAIQGNSNGVLQIKTHPFANTPISAGISVYGNDYSGMLITGNTSAYYQLGKRNSRMAMIGIYQNDFYIGFQNTFKTPPVDQLLRIYTSDNRIVLGNSRTFLHVRGGNGPVYVNSVSDSYDPLSTDTAFEVKGICYFRTDNNTPTLFTSLTGSVGIGKSTPAQQLDINGSAIFSRNVGFGTILPRTTLDVYNGSMTISGNIGIGTSLPVASLHVKGNVFYSASVGIGTLTPRTSLDVIGSTQSTVFFGDGSGLSGISSSNYKTFPWVSMYPLPSFINDSFLSYTTQKGLYRFVDSSIEYNVNIIASINQQPGAGTDYCLVLPYPVNTSIYSSLSSNVIGELWTEVITSNADMFFKTVARINPQNNRCAIVRILNGTYETKLSEIGAISTIKMMGTLQYATTSNTTGTSSNIDNFINIFDTNTIRVACNISIGSTSTSAQFYVGGNAYFENNLGIGTSIPINRFSITPSAFDAKITLYNGGSLTNHSGFGVSSGQLNYHINTSGSSHIFTTWGSSGKIELARITGTGLIGIGTSVPVSTLSVSGGINIGSYSNIPAPINGLIVSGNMGIGTSIPGSILSVVGGIGIGAYSNVVAPTNGLIISGSVGIGTNIPQASLDIIGRANVVRVWNGVSYGYITLSNGDSTTSPGFISFNMPSGRVGYAGSNAIDVANYLSLGNEGGYLGWKTMRNHLVDGKLGIGTNSPQSNVHVWGSTLIQLSGANKNNCLEVHGVNTFTTDYNLIAAGNGTNTTFVVKGSGSVGIGTYLPTNPLSVLGAVSIGTYASSNAPQNAFIVSGSVGIGITNPTSILDVNGILNINYTGGVSGSQVIRICPSTSGGETSIAFFQSLGNTGSSWKIGTNINNNGTGSISLYNSFAGNNMLTVTRTGNVGIGTDLSMSALSINGGVSVGSYSNISAPQNGMIVSGSVGIGTSLPLSDLQVLGTFRSTVSIETGPYATFNSTVSSNNEFLTWLTHTTNTFAGNWWGRASTPTYSTQTIVPLVTPPTQFSGGVLTINGLVVMLPDSVTYIGLFDSTTNSYVKYNISSYIAAGSGRFVGGVCLPDGRVLFVPYNNTKIGIFNPHLDTSPFRNIVTSPSYIAGNGAFHGGVLLPDGRVVFVPYNSSVIGVFTPSTSSYTTYAMSPTPPSAAYKGGVLLPNGKVIFVPFSASLIGIFDPYTNQYSTYSFGSVGNYSGGAILPDGRVVFSPELNSKITPNIGIFNPNTSSFNTISGVQNSYSGCVLAPDGRVVMVPNNGNTYLIFTPSTTGGTFTEINMNPTPGATSPFVGGLLLPDGRIIFIPNNAKMIGFLSGFPRPPRQLCYHPCFNKL